MKLSNFTNYKVVKTKRNFFEEERRYADVTCETGRLWWNKTEVRQISREVPGFWFFVDTGAFTPFSEAETLERAYLAKGAFK